MISILASGTELPDCQTLTQNQFNHPAGTGLFSSRFQALRARLRSHRPSGTRILWMANPAINRRGLLSRVPLGRSENRLSNVQLQALRAAEIHAKHLQGFNPGNH
jgi:hypothetical protein